MANYPQGVSFCVNTGVILELVDENPDNQFVQPNIGFGYIRQLGPLAFVGVLDQIVQYRTDRALQFIQLGVTYVYVDATDILFIQAVLPPL